MRIKIVVLNHIVLLIGLLFLSNASGQTKEGFVLDGEILGLKNSTKLYLCINPGNDTVAKIIAKDGKFKFTGQVKHGSNVYFIKMDTMVSKLPSKAIWLTNKPIKVRSNLTKWPVVEVTGSEAQDDYNLMLKRWNAVKDKKNDGLKIVKDFIKSHSNSLYVGALLATYRTQFSSKEFEDMYDSLTPRAKNSYYGLRLKFAKEIKEGGHMPDFKISSFEGQPISVLNYVKKNKITLIDFWASWCSPCRAVTPNLKKVYGAFYEKGFDIIGVSTDKNEAAWRKALEEDDTPWFHGRDNIERAAKGIFSIASIPAFALVDGEGKMIAFSCGKSTIPSFGPEIRDEGLYKTVEDLLSKTGK